MDYFVNDIRQLEEDVQKNHGFDFDVEEVVYTDFEDFFHIPNAEVFYSIIDHDSMELVRILENSASTHATLTETMSLLVVDDVRFLLFDFIDICILLIDKLKKEELNNLINSLI